MTAVPTLLTPASPRGHVARLWALIVSHGVVDFFSYTIIPILTVLEGRVGMSPAQGAALLAVGSIASGLIQPFTAWLGDRFDTRWFGTLGMLAAVIAISLLGHAHAYWHLVLIQVVGSAGVGAFHPPYAAAMGHLSGRRRALGISIFIAAGLSGGVAGTSIIPYYVKAFTPEALLYLAAPGLAMSLLLALCVQAMPHRAHDAHRVHGALDPGERRSRWRAVALIYAANAVRFIVSMMIVQLVIRWSEEEAMRRAGVATLTPELRTAASTIGGPIQAAMQIGMGGAGLVLGFAVRERHERAALVLIPCLSTAAVLAFPFVTTQAAAFCLALIAGVGYAGVMPITIALAQRLLPHRTGLASGLVMGGAWCMAFIGPPLAQRLYQSFGMPTAFAVAGAMLVASGLMMLALRRA